MAIGLLSVLIWLPIVGGLVLMILGERLGRADRWVALAIAAVTFALSLPLYMGYDATTADMQFVERLPWIDAFRVEYFLGIDGFSLPLILLTTFPDTHRRTGRLGSDQDPRCTVFRGLPDP